MTKFRSLLAAISFLSLFGMSPSAHAVVIGFDDLGAITEQALVDGYQGFHWSNFWALNYVNDGYVGTGYEVGTISLDNVGFDAYGDGAGMSSDTTFTLNGGYFTSAWDTVQTVSLKGYLDGVEVYSEERTITNVAPLYVGLDWVGIDEFTFIGSGSQIAVDNLKINESCEVPLPAALPLFASALGLMGFGVSRKRKA